MKNILIFFSVLFPLIANSQIFQQSFNKGNRYTTYVGQETNKFNVISNFGNAPVSIADGAIRWHKKASSSAFFTKSSAILPAKFLKAEFSFSLAVPDELNDYSKFSAQLFIGGGDEPAWIENSSPATPSSVFAKVTIKPNVTGSEAAFSVYNSQAFTGKQKLTVYANNTGDVVKYKGPDAKESTLPNKAYDVYVGDKKIMNGAKAQNINTELAMFKFVYPSNAPNALIEIGDFIFTDLANDQSVSRVETPKQIIDKDPNILLAWQFTYPEETSGREVAYLATTNHQKLETGRLSRGFNAAPGAGSKRGFTGLFPIENSRGQAEVSGSYYEVNIKPKKNEEVSLKSIESTMRRQKDSPYIYRWTYSLDGKTFKNIGDKDIVINDLNSLGVKQPIVNLSNYPDLQNIKHTQKVLLRMYVWGATANTGHERSFGFGKSSDEGANVLVIKGNVKQ